MAEGGTASLVVLRKGQPPCGTSEKRLGIGEREV